MKGLKYKKADLHVHTPASKCFFKKHSNVTPDEFVDYAIEQGIEVMAITDHNSAAWVDKIKKAAEGKNITIFPGVEIGAKDGFHVVGIFDIDKDTTYIDDLLRAGLGYKAAELGKSEIRPCDFEEVVEKILKYDGIPIIAHLDSKGGPLSEIVNPTRLTQILENENYIAVETETGCMPNDLSFIDDIKIKNKILTKLKEIKRDVIFYKASDNPCPTDPKKHSYLGIGNKYTYFKLESENINLAGLKACFIDPEVRIKICDEIENDNYSYIQEISVEGGFLNNQKPIFHNGLNSLIGGKGTGKSLIIEFLRFALDDFSQIPSIIEDNFSKIGGQLKEDGKVEVIISKGGIKYKITRKIISIDNKNKRFEEIHTCVNLSDGNPYEGSIKELFPILSYSQGEIIEIAKDDKAQLFLLDTFIDKTLNDLEIQEIKRELQTVNSEFINSFTAEQNKILKTRDLKTQEEELKGLQQQIKQLTSEDFQILKNQKEATDKELIAISTLKKHIQENYIDKIETVLSTSSILNNKTTFTEKIINDFHSNFIKKMSDLITEIKQNKENVDQCLNIKEINIKQRLEPINKSYTELQENSQKSKGFEEQETKIKGIIEELKNHLTEIEETATKVDYLKNKRIELINKFKQLNTELYENRKRLYTEITELSNTKLKLELENATDKNDFVEAYEKLLSGSRIRNKTENIITLIDNLSFDNLFEAILNKDYETLNNTLSSENTGKTIADWLWDNNKMLDFMNLQHNFYPEDTPIIKYNKGNENYAKLNELSTGQKCNALLIIALLKGNFPVIIDQPEDALDITSVYEDISQNLRKNKDKRQFIITTHNNCVAVSSDSDNFICLQSNGTNGSVEVKGSIESSLKEIMAHLEGGKESYNLRNKKYLIKN